MLTCKDTTTLQAQMTLDQALNHLTMFDYLATSQSK